MCSSRAGAGRMERRPVLGKRVQPELQAGHRVKRKREPVAVLRHVCFGFQVLALPLSPLDSGERMPYT